MPKEPKIIQLDPLAERLSNVGMEGGASKKISKPKKRKQLSKEAREALKETTRRNLRYSKEVSKDGREGIFGTPLMSQSAAKELKTSAKERTLKSEMDFPSSISGFPKNITTKGKDEARKYLKKKKIQYQKDTEFFQKRGYNNGGLIKGFPKLAKRGF
jgi:hypothetical protein